MKVEPHRNPYAITHGTYAGTRGNVSKHEGICLICGSLPLSQILLFFSSTVKCLHSIGSLDESPWKAPRHLPPQGELAQWVVCASCCFSCAMCNRCLISTITVKTSLPLSLLWLCNCLQFGYFWLHMFVFRFQCLRMYHFSLISIDEREKDDLFCRIVQLNCLSQLSHET